MLSTLFLVLLSTRSIESNVLILEEEGGTTPAPIDEEQEIKFTVFPNKDYFGRAVIVIAEPPRNYTAWLYGPFSSIQPRLVNIYFNESGIWDNPGFRGNLEPYTWYNLTIIAETRNFSTSFITDVAVPIGGVDMIFTKNGSDFVEVNLKPQFLELVYGPPTGYHVEACLAPRRESCSSYVCLESPCRLDKLLPGTNYTVNGSIFNVDTFNRTLERRNYVKLYNVTTTEGSSDTTELYWILAGGAIAGVVGFGGIGVVGRNLSKRGSRRRSEPSDAPAVEVSEL